MRLIFIYGFFSSQTRGPYRVSNIGSHDLSGSESFFFNMVKTLADFGHEIEAHGYWCYDYKEGNIHYIPFRMRDGVHADVVLPRAAGDYDAAVVWNEPDYLSIFPSSVKKICVQQLNDFDYCGMDYKSFTDLFLFPSQRHLEHMIQRAGLDPAKCGVLSNCISNEDNFSTEFENHTNHKIVYCSSPDRGLHWLCDFFPEVRKRVPDAELHIYYRIDTWLNRFNTTWTPTSPAYHELGFRARYITEFLRRWNEKNGVFLHGPVSNKKVAEALMTARVLAYPCDPVVFTEGFGVSVLDACTAGSVPLISDTDAFGQVYGDVAFVIPGKPGESRRAWVDGMVRSLTDYDLRQQITSRCREFARGFTRRSRAEALLAAIKH